MVNFVLTGLFLSRGWQIAGLHLAASKPTISPITASCSSWQISATLRMKSNSNRPRLLNATGSSSFPSKKNVMGT